jgi:hypothetical protein
VGIERHGWCQDLSVHAKVMLYILYNNRAE